MRHICRSKLGLLLAFLVAMLVPLGCDSSRQGSDDPMSGLASEENEQDEENERPHYYSPYFLEGQGDLAFQTISFTDVGLSPLKEGPVDGFILETIAESLAYTIIEHEELNFTPQVKHDLRLADPTQHLFCEEHHLYIALWRGFEPERWGFSLWSGCEDYHEFAWEEVVDPLEEGEEDILNRVEPLTARIVEKIEQAHRQGCYTSMC